ncbi:MAG: class I SAM-dependent methyltransferase, partial [Deltaproteobacteria bacterium]|nr:class I SAM-dependent methyltransferase [Deltaproteobacteria bacterium]
FSGDKLLGALQRLAALLPETSSYVEVGVFDGLTLLSVAGACPALACFGIDDGSFAGGDFSSVDQIQQARGNSNARVIVDDYERVFEQFRARIGERPIGLYFVDGPHDYRSQRMCLDLAVPYLATDAVIVVDDSNYEHVRQANRDFLVSRPEFRLVFDAYTDCHPHNMTEAQIVAARAGWWDGVNIMVRDPDSTLERTYPPVAASRDRYLLDHRIHASGAAPFMSDVVALAESILTGDVSPRAALRSLVTIARTRIRSRARFKNCNTDSDALPASRYASLCSSTSSDRLPPL